MALAEGRRLHRLADSDPGRDSRGGLVVVDAGTGSGAIALALASELGPRLLREVWATDVSADALEVAAANVEARRASFGGRPFPRVELAEGSWLEALPACARGAGRPPRGQPALCRPRANGPGWRPRCGAEPRRALVAGPGSDGTPGLADVEALLEECRVLAGAAGQRRDGAGPPPGRARSAAGPPSRLRRGPGRAETSWGGHAPWSYGPAADGGRGRGRGRPWGRGRGGSGGPPSAVGAGAGEVVDALEGGSIIAVPAVGGYSLAVRAGSPEAETATDGIGGRPRRAPLCGRPR